MAEEKQVQAGLIEAATAFDRELQEFARLAQAARRCPLDSQKNLQRIARTYQQVSQSEARLGAAAQALVAAIGAARERQQAQVVELQERAEEVRQRTAAASELLRRYAALGEEAAQLSAQVREAAERGREAGPGDAGAGLISSLTAVHQRMSQLAGDAQALMDDARTADFEDIARQADSLRQQLLSARSKLSTVPAVHKGVLKA